MRIVIFFISKALVGCELLYTLEFDFVKFFILWSFGILSDEIFRIGGKSLFFDTSKLTAEKYAVNTDYYVYAAYFNALLTYGMETAFFRFFFKRKR